MVKTKRSGTHNGVPGIRLADEKDPLLYMGRKSWLPGTYSLATLLYLPHLAVFSEQWAPLEDEPTSKH